MSRTMIASLMVAVFVVSLLSGCAPSAKIALTFAPQQTARYESISKMIKDVDFDQPSLKKSKKEQVSTTITVKFDQTIADVQPDGTATADIAIRAVQFKQVNKDEVRLAFDSTAEKSKNEPLSKIIGQSYRIAMDPNGAVKVIDAAKARAAVSGSDEQKKIAQKILSDESIIERHQLPLPKAGQNMISAGKTWTQVVPSPPGLLAPKFFEKVYTVSTADKSKTVVTMSARENLKQKAETPKNTGNLGFLAKLFDNQDEYTGKIVLNPAGTLAEYEETLVSSYTAQDKPKDAAQDVAPDTLIMRLTYGISVKKVN
ncbi:MAG: hypothetical protein FJ263_01615 [Planctomycetes bacterium]|nr:hypothetical protein [Planctomycetota bacterium]